MADMPTWYFDLANPDLVGFLCRQLAHYRAKTGYDGHFLDYAGAWALTPPASALWKQRHPDLPYDQALLRFLRRLRAVDRGTLIATNQACRSEEPLLSQVDYDMTESYGTALAWGPETEVAGKKVTETYYRPWAAPAGVEALYSQLEQRLRRTPPRRGFLYLDYMQPGFRRGDDGALVESLDLEAVCYSYGAAALWGRASYCCEPLWQGKPTYRGDLYFADLGRPLGDAPEVRDGVALRHYERGLVALLTGTESAEFAVTVRDGAVAALQDAMSGARFPVAGGRVRLRLQPARYGLSGGLHPVARVYLKLRD